MRIASVGHAVFAAVVIGLGVLGLVKGDFAPVWQPVPDDVPGRAALVYLCVVVCLGTGAGLLWRRSASAAARVLLAYLLLWMLVFRVHEGLAAPDVVIAWYGCAEVAGIAAGAWVLYAWFAPDWDRKHLGFATGNSGLRIARVMFGLALIPFGLAHFLFLERTVSMVPHWLPAPTFWAYLTAVGFLAAAAAMVTGVLGRLAATLAAFQIGAFTVLVWIPILSAGQYDEFEWGEFVVTVTLFAAGWVVAESYRGTPWLAVGNRSAQS